MTFLELVRLAHSKKYSYRASLDNKHARGVPKIAPKRVTRPIVNLESDYPGTTGSPSAGTRDNTTSGEVNLVTSRGGDESLSAPSCPTAATSTVEDVDLILYMDRCPSPLHLGLIQSGPPSFPCHDLYEKGHLKPNYPLPRRELARFQYNYSKLSE